MAAFRAAIQPTLDRAAVRIAKNLAPKDHDRVVARGRAFFAEQPRTFDDLRKALEKETKKKEVVRAMAYLVRMRVPLVQVATDADWGWPAAADFALAEDVVGSPFAKTAELDLLVRRYLAALGPASVADAQTFTGIAGLKPVFERLRPTLVTFRDDRGKELFDLPDAPRPSPDTGRAPVRFLPDFDNIAIGHADRRRFVADEHKSRVFLPGLVVARTFLVDGKVAGTWNLVDKKKTATLEVAPFASVAKKTKAAIEEEAEALLDFAAPDAAERDLRFVAD
jgi:Winged helix DNA-binding domain